MFSKEDSDTQIDMVRGVRIPVDRESSQPTVLGGKKKVRTRAVNEIQK